MISVLIPVYNSGKYLRNCLNSLIQQSYIDFEIVILNDGSIDDSQKIIDEFALKDNRIRPLYKENEKSISKTRNYLLKEIRGDYFIFVDSDDVVEKDFLKILYETINKTKSDIVSCGFKILKTPTLIKRGVGLKEVDSEKALDLMMFSGKFYAVWNKLIKTSALKDNKFDEELNYGEDLLFFFNLLKTGLRFTFIENRLYYYRIRPNSLSTSAFSDSKKEFLTRLIEYSKDDSYKEIKDIINIWIYSVARFYRFETRHLRKENKEYRLYLKDIIKTYKPYYRSKEGHITYKMVISFFSMF